MRPPITAIPEGMLIPASGRVASGVGVGEAFA